MNKLESITLVRIQIKTDRKKRERIFLYSIFYDYLLQL